MNQANNNEEAMSILARMFKAEMQFMESGKENFSEIAKIFHPDIIINEPTSMPYAGKWKGYEELGKLFKQMHDSWRNITVEDMEATIDGDTLFMHCILVATARKTGIEIRQPFAEILRILDGLVIEGTPYYYDTAAINVVLEYSPL